MTIKVLGPGCMNCKTLERRTAEALKKMNLEASIEKVTDFQQIASYGILRTPGLVVENKVIVQGRVPSVEQIQELLASHVA
ncbi:MAG: TM0996/MTH895 family glutaredoxin-like protein [Ignavibacteriales bacterium]|nr:TM0996/MTH895 family glutaredoxin-like protein [Ignavibacteriales bacterium]